MKSLGQIQVFPGNPEKNLNNVLAIIEQAKQDGSDFLLLPEMVIPGYMLGDKWERQAYIKECSSMNQDIIDATKGDITVAWGNVSYDENKKNEDGRIRKYNSMFIAKNGTLLGLTHKTLLPNYRMFDDKRHFTSLEDLAREEGINLEEYYKPFDVIIGGVKKKISMLICEDIWNLNNDYKIDPVKLTLKHNPDIIAVSSASPFGINKQNMRERILEKSSKDIEIMYVNPIGIQNNGKNIYTFEGGSAFYKNGQKKIEVPDFSSGVFNIIEKTQSKNLKNISDYKYIYDTLIYAIKEFFKSIGQTKVVVGLSGGLDSAVVTALCVKALGKKNVISVNMPSKFNSNTTKNLARELADNLDIEYRVISIQESVENTKKQLNKTSLNQVTDFVFENIQARDRGSRLLAGISAQENAVFTNNGNKSETALGYATLYGDVNGALAVIGDLYKSQVFELARYINEVQGNIIPNEIIDMKPSAELSDKQNVDKGEGDPFNYEFLDKVLYQYIELRKMPEDILEYYIEGKLEEKLGLDNNIKDYYENISEFISDIEKYFRQIEINFFKRVQSPPIISLSKRPFGYDLRESQDAPYYETRNYKKLKSDILSTLILN